VPIGVPIGVVSAIFTAVVTEVYCHRYLAHRAFRLRPLPALLLDTYVRIIVGTDPESWAGVHRLHPALATRARWPLGSTSAAAPLRPTGPPGTEQMAPARA